MTNETEDNLARIVTPKVFEFVRRNDMPDDILRTLSECTTGTYEFPRGYVLRSRQDVENKGYMAWHYNKVLIFHRAKGLFPSEVLKLCRAVGIPARLYDEDRVAILPMAAN